MEAWTSATVSAAARKVRLRDRPGESDRFKPIRGGYRYYGFESNIQFVRAGGRGWALGSGKPIHRFDRKPCGCVSYCDHT